MHTSDITIKIIDFKNVNEFGVYCVKDLKSPGFKAKSSWLSQGCNQDVTLLAAYDANGKQTGFIEYTSSENAWRPVKAVNYQFIHCIAVLSKANRDKNVASGLIGKIEQDARRNNKSGLCTMASDGVWMANKSIFEKCGFNNIQQRGRFQLMVKIFDEKAPLPYMPDWEKNLQNLAGWHLMYADQCPWHEKSVSDLADAARETGIILNIRKLLTAEEAQNAPSGFGTFALVKDNRLLEDHYISRTRFENIIRQELKK